jgi:hypothetical protein
MQSIALCHLVPTYRLIMKPTVLIPTQGGHELMDLNSGQVITQNIVHEIPVTDVVIKAVKIMAYKQGFKSMKFKNRNGVVFFDTDWIAGVDYEEDDIEDDGDEDAPYR